MGKFKELKVDIVLSADAILGKHFPVHITSKQSTPRKLVDNFDVNDHEEENKNAASK